MINSQTETRKLDHAPSRFHDQVTFQVSLCEMGLLLYITETHVRTHAKLTQTSKEGLPSTKESPSGGNCECWKTIMMGSLLDYRTSKLFQRFQLCIFAPLKPANI